MDFRIRRTLKWLMALAISLSLATPCLASRPTVRGFSEVLVSGTARTASVEVVAESRGYKGAYFTLDVTAAPNTADTIQFYVQVAQPVQTGTANSTEQYRSIFAGTAIAGSALQSGNRLQSYLIYPGVVETSAQGNSEVQAMVLPNKFKVIILHSGSGSFTYSVSAHYIH